MYTENVKIVELNAENWYDCCELEVSTEQKEYIEPNAISIAQSKFEHTLKPYAIYFEEKVVGFIMYNSIPEELDGYWVYRIMVDKEFQCKGIGKEATKLMITEMAKLPNVKKIVVGYHPENLGAHYLYSSLGFIDNGDRFGKEMAVIKYINE
ncbi:MULTISPECIES: GNAT family N-acetyltransferase [unclassified Peribacillus]|uniref:GNAT family N-acetyltransferase n=1 Tax=unclassified Peribacillus TaxID=2675266 RepID=UPI0019123AF0|nr:MULTISPECIES: GNAT family N-acetyltransferase [unclassified Peribacillus]MBK5441809.1 GNAT family N-acetyltransferase [Peribacillus sp. TH24]MBK5463414.1 GNAT family N-acetyltransferase [Peribacillus sp. TH27]